MSVTAEVIDAAVHPMVRRGDELQKYMGARWKNFTVSGPHRYLFPTPVGIPPYSEYRNDARPANGDLPGSDPALTEAHLDELGIGRAILLPLTRGMLPNIDLGSAVCAATNDWLAATWLGPWNPGGRYLGTIRVNPADPEGAVQEIERWSDDPRFVQIGVPLEAHRPYGQRNYTPIWEAAVEHDLPVAVHSDSGGGIDFYPSPTGYHRTYIEYHSLFPANFIYHLASLIDEGTFERIPQLRFVFADGGFDVLMPLMWRMDLDWPISRVEIPWVTKRPSLYLRDHVRFCTAKLEGPPEPILSEWLEVAGGADLLMFGSNYPHWSTMSPAEFFPSVKAETRDRVLGQNAREFYGRLDRVKISAG